MRYTPKFIKFQRFFKKRTIKKFSQQKLKFGDNGLLLTKNLFISNKNFNNYLIYIARSIKKKSRSNKKVWFKCTLSKFLTKKAKGSRMGKGKGKFKTYSMELKPGLIFIEFRNFRIGKIKYIKKHFVYKFGTNLFLI